MHIGSILVILALSLFLVAYISQPFQAGPDDTKKIIEDRVAEIRKGTGGKQLRYCSQCGHQLKPDDRFCSQCGHPVEAVK